MLWLEPSASDVGGKVPGPQNHNTLSSPIKNTDVKVLHRTGDPSGSTMSRVNAAGDLPASVFSALFIPFPVFELTTPLRV